MQHYGIANVWLQGDFVTRAIVIVLAIMSITSWSMLLIRTFYNRRIGRLGKLANGFWEKARFDDGIDALGSAIDNPYRELALAGRQAYEQQYGGQSMLQGNFGAAEWINRCVRHALDTQVSKLQSGISVLASIGSTSPFVGLFGTVWGIYHALEAIGVDGQASLDHVAGPVGESLIMTAFGLFVAIPAVLGYNAVNRSNRKLSHTLGRFAHEIQVYLVMNPGRADGSTKGGKRTPEAGNAAAPASSSAPLAMEA
jgi:biopolymer transport protein ExbB